MRTLDVSFWVDDREEVVTYSVEGRLKRPGDAVRTAREAAIDDGYDDLNLEEVSLAEPP